MTFSATHTVLNVQEISNQAVVDGPQNVYAVPVGNNFLICIFTSKISGHVNLIMNIYSERNLWLLSHRMVDLAPSHKLSLMLNFIIIVIINLYYFCNDVYSV